MLGTSFISFARVPLAIFHWILFNFCKACWLPDINLYIARNCAQLLRHFDYLKTQFVARPIDTNVGALEILGSMHGIH